MSKVMEIWQSFAGAIHTLHKTYVELVLFTEMEPALTILFFLLFFSFKNTILVEVNVVVVENNLEKHKYPRHNHNTMCTVCTT